MLYLMRTLLLNLAVSTTIRQFLGLKSENNRRTIHFTAGFQVALVTGETNKDATEG